MDNTVKVEVQKRAKGNNWKSFFNLKIFRYAFLKQAKSISTYIILAIAIIYCTFTLKFIYSFSESETTIEISKSLIFLLYIFMFTLFMTFKVLQIFRDEINDGTLLIFSSMPYSRLRLIFQKWLALQLILLMFNLLFGFVPPVFYTTLSGFSDFSKLVLKGLYQESWVFIFGALTYQTIISSLALLISLFLGKKVTIGLFIGFSYFLCFVSIVPTFIQITLGYQGKKMQQEMNAFAIKKDNNILNKPKKVAWYPEKGSTKPLDEILINFENYQHKNKLNSYLNVMTQIDILLFKYKQYENVAGQWEIKEAVGSDPRHLELKLDSVKVLVRPKWLYIIYTSISVVLSITIIYIVNRKDIT